MSSYDDEVWAASPAGFVMLRGRPPAGGSARWTLRPVAAGCVFPDGTVALRWSGVHGSTSTWASMADLRAVSGHDGTVFQWTDPAMTAVSNDAAQAAAEGWDRDPVEWQDTPGRVTAAERLALFERNPRRGRAPGSEAGGSS